jgi:ribosomal protein L37E
VEKVEEAENMVDIKCQKCGHLWYHDFSIASSIEACPMCGTPHRITRSIDQALIYAWKVEPVYPSLDELSPVWDSLTPIEKNRLREAALCFGVEAYTMCESACFDALTSLLRRVYGGRGELGFYVDKMESDPDLKDEAGFIASFRFIRNRVDHPDRISTRLEAESTFSTTKRLVLTIVKKKLKK